MILRTVWKFIIRWFKVRQIRRNTERSVAATFRYYNTTHTTGREWSTKISNPAWGILARRKAAKLIPSAGFGSCHCCHLPWYVVAGHTTYYKDGQGCFPLCTQCWHDLNPQERIQFYLLMWYEWQLQGCTEVERDWDLIERAVLEGR